MSIAREDVLDAALAAAAAEGLEALSMRGLAAAVGVTPMALYPHVGSKAQLVDALVGRLFASALAAVPTGEPTAGPTGEPVPGWRVRLAALGHAVRALGREHPWVAPRLLGARPAVPEVMRAVDLVYVALLDAGVPAAQVPRLERLVSSMIISFVASEGPGRFTVPADAAEAAGLPGHARLGAIADRPVDIDAEFEADVSDLLDLVALAADRATVVRGR